MAEWEPFFFASDPYYWAEMFIPENTIFFRCQTFCGMDSGVIDYILSPKVSIQITRKRANGNPSFSALNSY